MYAAAAAPVIVIALSNQVSYTVKKVCYKPVYMPYSAVL